MLKNGIAIVAIIGFIYGQQANDEQVNFSDYKISSEKYMTDANGNIMMYVNVWGEVIIPGHHLVYEGIDLGTLLSMVGGSNINANLQKVRLHRELPDSDGRITYEIDLSKFIDHGDRSNFVKIKPNDTIFIPTKILPIILKQVGTISTIMTFLNLLLTLQSR